MERAVSDAPENADKSNLDALLARAVRLTSNPTAALVAMLRAVDAAHGVVDDQAVAVVAARAGVKVGEVRAMARRAGIALNRREAKHHLEVCVGATCSLRGSEALLIEAEKLLGVSTGDVRADGVVALDRVYCLGACDFGPNVRWDDAAANAMSPRRLRRLVSDIAQRPGKKPWFWPFG